MPPRFKRPRRLSSQSISPPPVKRSMVTNVSSEPSAQVQGDCAGARVFSWNVNGANPLLQKRIPFTAGSGFPLREFLRRHRWPQFLCLQEVKISWKNEASQRQLLHAANAGQVFNEPIYTIQFSLPRDKYNATGFGGKVHGVASLIREDFTHLVKRTRTPDWDLEGRVLIHELTNGVTIINGYWVNGTNNPYRNPVTGVEQGTRHDHKLFFHRQMLEEALTIANSGGHVVLVGDVNVAREHIDGHPNLRTTPARHVYNRSDFNYKFFTGTDGLKAVDVFRKFHGAARKYTYHPRGCGWGQSCDRVDLIMVTGALLAMGVVLSTDICDNPQDRGHSDHVPVWVELDFTKIPCSKPLLIDSASSASTVFCQ